MFHRVSHASKVALFHLIEHLRQRGFILFDIQMRSRPSPRNWGASLFPAPNTFPVSPRPSSNPSRSSPGASFGRDRGITARASRMAGACTTRWTLPAQAGNIPSAPPAGSGRPPVRCGRRATHRLAQHAARVRPGPTLMPPLDGHQPKRHPHGQAHHAETPVHPLFFCPRRDSLCGEANLVLRTRSSATRFRPTPGTWPSWIARRARITSAQPRHSPCALVRVRGQEHAATAATLAQGRLTLQFGTSGHQGRAQDRSAPIVYYLERRVGERRGD